MKNISEIWKPIIYSDNYLISNLGNVKTIGRYIETSYRRRFQKEKLMKLKIQKTGNRIDHVVVCLFINGKSVQYSASKLVYMHFNNDFEIPKDMCITHLDKNPLNNCAYNLMKVSWSKSAKISYQKSIIAKRAQLNNSLKGAKAMKLKAIKKNNQLKPE